jgi:hypothetical protein
MARHAVAPHNLYGIVLPVQGYDGVTAKVKLSGQWADWWLAHGSFETWWSCRW